MAAAGVEVGRLVVRLIGDVSSFQRAFKQAERDSESTAFRIGAALRSIGIAAGIMTVAAVKAFATFEQALAKLKSVTTGLSTDNLKELKKSIEDIAIATGVTPAKTAEAFAELMKAGASADKVMKGLGDTVVKFSKVSGVGPERAAVVIMDAVNMFKEEGVTGAQVANAISKAADSTTASMSNIVEAYEAGGVSMREFGFTFEEITRMIALNADQALKGEKSGNALKTMFQRLAAPSREVREIMEEYGIRVRGANGEMLRAEEIYRNFRTTLAGLNQEEIDHISFTLGMQRGVRQLNIIIDKSDEGLREMGERIEKAKELEQKFTEQNDSMIGSLERLWSQTLVVASAFGERMAPAVKGIVDSIDGAIKHMHGWSEGTKQYVANVVLATTAITALGFAIKILMAYNVHSFFILAAQGAAFLTTKLIACTTAAGALRFTIGGLAVLATYQVLNSLAADAVAKLNVQLERNNELTGKQIANMKAPGTLEEAKKRVKEYEDLVEGAEKRAKAERESTHGIIPGTVAAIPTAIAKLLGVNVGGNLADLAEDVMPTIAGKLTGAEGAQLEQFKALLAKAKVDEAAMEAQEEAKKAEKREGITGLLMKGTRSAAHAAGVGMSRLLGENALLALAGAAVVSDAVSTSVDGMGDAFKDAGDKIDKTIKELYRFDAAAFGSAEAMSRILFQFAGAGLPGSFRTVMPLKKKQAKFDGNFFPDNPRGVKDVLPEEAKRVQKLLEEIRDAVKQKAKEVVEVQPAGFED